MDSSDRLPVSDETLEMLRQTGTATLATVLFKLGFKNRALTNVRAIVPDTRMVGEAFTVRYIPMREDLDSIEVLYASDNVHRQVFDEIEAGQVLVLDARGDERGSLMGDILAMRMKQRGAAGVVTDGCVRDGSAIRAVGLPCYARGDHPNATFHLHHAVDKNVPIACGDVAVYPGDMVVGDADGVVVIPRHLTEQVARSGFDQEQMEAWILQRVASGAPLAGTYPPSDATKAEYRRWRESQPGSTT